MIAALGFQRHFQAQGCEQARGPGAGSQHHLIGGDIFTSAAHTNHALALGQNGLHLGSANLSTHPAHAIGNHGSEPRGIHTGTVIREVKANLVIFRNFRFQFTQRRPDQLLHLQPVSLPERE